MEYFRIIELKTTEQIIQNKLTLYNYLKNSFELAKTIDKYSHKVVLVPYQPTSENMLFDFAEKIKSQLPQNVSLHSLRLNETANSYAEWFAEDQL